MDEIAEWWNSFILETKSNGKVRLCLDPGSSCFTTFTCQFVRYTCKGYSIWSNLYREYVSTKIDEIFKDLLNAFGIADDIWLHDVTMMARTMMACYEKVLQICRQLKSKTKQR